MLDHDNLRRLAEMGIEVYLPRSTLQRDAVARPPLSAAESGATRVEWASISEVVDGTAAQAAATVVLLADATTEGARALVANVVRALGFARIVCVLGEARDEAELAGAHAMVMFGDRQARAAGALVPAQRQREIGWVVGAELSALAANGSAKRALWSELKRMVGELAARAAVARR